MAAATEAVTAETPEVTAETGTLEIKPEKSAAEIMEQAKLDATGLHSRSEIREVDVAKLRVDRSYQRDVSQKIVEDIAADWNEVASELILVSNRGSGENGGLYVINGQHRTMAAKRLGMPKIWARVVRLSDLDDPGTIEADLRLRTNAKLADRPYERFKAQLRAGDPQSLAIQELLKKYDTHINLVPSKSGDGLNSVAAVEQVYEIDDGKLLSDVLDLVRKARGKVNHETAPANMIKALAWVLEKHAMELDFNRMAEALKSLTISQIMMRASMRQGAEGGAAWLNVYAVLLDLYNEGLPRRDRLTYTKRGVYRRGRGSAVAGDAE